MTKLNCSSDAKIVVKIKTPTFVLAENSTYMPFAN